LASAAAQSDELARAAAAEERTAEALSDETPNAAETF
jgi:hypothetical protein